MRLFGHSLPEVMSVSASIWLVIFSAFVAANLPFVSQRLFLFGPLVQPKKSLWLRLLELLLLYCTIGVLGFLLEKRVGQISPQGWEFYAVTATLFVTFAFPGFVYRYLMHHRA